MLHVVFLVHKFLYFYNFAVLLLTRINPEVKVVEVESLQVGIQAIAEALSVAAVKAVVAIIGIIAGGRLVCAVLYSNSAKLFRFY